MVKPLLQTRIDNDLLEKFKTYCSDSFPNNTCCVQSIVDYMIRYELKNNLAVKAIKEFKHE